MPYFDFFEYFYAVSAFVGQPIEVKLVGEDSQSPDVAFEGVVKVDGFGTHVVGGPHKTFATSLYFAIPVLTSLFVFCF